MAARGRTCVGCRRQRRKEEMLRVVRGVDGSVALDPEGTAPGRGAYLCPDPACLDRARRRLAGALRSDRIDFAAVEAGFAIVIRQRGGESTAR